MFKNQIKLSFGGGAISGEGGGYGFGKISTQDSVQLLEHAFNLGIRTFDTAPIYGYGESEKRIGQTFKNKRDQVYYVSKSGVSWHPATKRVDMTNDPQITQKMLDQSLIDLQTDYLDLYMIHWPDHKIDIRKPMEVLLKAKLEGKIKSIGLCNSNESDYIKAKEIAPIDVLQGPLNVFDQSGLLSVQVALKNDPVEFMSYGTLDKGILTGRVTPQRSFDPEDCRSWAPWWKSSDKEWKWKTLAEITPLLEKENVSYLDLALAHNLSIPLVSTLIVGSRTLEQWNSLFESYSKVEKNLTQYKSLLLKIHEVVLKNRPL